MMPCVTIIVPVYNSEKNITECINSILGQTFKDFELILIDDGSVDKSGMICDDYANRDSRIVVAHTTNKGVCAARNKGIEMAKGQFIMFCDADDVVNKHWCEYLYDVITFNEKCLVLTSFCRSMDIVALEEPKIVEDCKFYNIFKTGLSGSVCNKIFNRNTIINNNVYFDASIPLAEDVIFVAEYMKYCKGVKWIQNNLYYYRVNDESALHRYNPYAAMYHCKAFYMRALVVEPEYLSAYCDEWLGGLLRTMDNVFDERNTSWTWIQKMKFNQSIISSKECMFCVSHSSTRKESPLMIFLLKHKLYIVMYCLQKISVYKNRFS